MTTNKIKLDTQALNNFDPGELQDLYKSYETVIKFADQFKKDPNKFLDMFALIGVEVIKRSENKMFALLEEHAKTFVSSKNIQLSENALKALESLVDFIKKNNQVATDKNINQTELKL